MKVFLFGGNEDRKHTCSLLDSHGSSLISAGESRKDTRVRQNNHLVFFSGNLDATVLSFFLIHMCPHNLLIYT